MWKKVVMAWSRGQPWNLPTVNCWIQEISNRIACVATDIWTTHVANVTGCGINFTLGSWAVMLTLGCSWQTCVCDRFLSSHSKEYETVSTLFTALWNRHTFKTVCLWSICRCEEIMCSFAFSIQHSFVRPTFSNKLIKPFLQCSSLQMYTLSFFKTQVIISSQNNVT